MRAGVDVRLSLARAVVGLGFGGVTTTGLRLPGLFSAGAAVWLYPELAEAAAIKAARLNDARLEDGAMRPSRLKTDITKKIRRRTHNRQRSRRSILPSPQTANVTSIRHIGAPRPTRLRMTMTGSRFPGSRVNASDHLPRTNLIPVVFMVVGYPPTVAGAAAELPARADAPHSLG